MGEFKKGRKYYTTEKLKVVYLIFVTAEVAVDGVCSVEEGITIICDTTINKLQTNKCYYSLCTLYHHNDELLSI